MNAHSQSEARQALRRSQEPSAIALWTAITTGRAQRRRRSPPASASRRALLEAELDPSPTGRAVEHAVSRLAVDLDARVLEQQLTQRLAKLDRAAEVGCGRTHLALGQLPFIEPGDELPGEPSASFSSRSSLVLTKSRMSSVAVKKYLTSKLALLVT